MSSVLDEVVTDKRIKYFIGIIDFLTPYSKRKKAEKFMNFFGSSDSCQSPDDY